ncbi:MAG: sugar-transfer associated ATP-grasp domain-containing protein [Clostridia bacterium]|nr:sugar-transfer associated ATP-grasp domain-containing protein [Clostridia bacterium]
MSRLSIFFKRVKDGSLNRMNLHAHKIKEETGRPVILTELDMAWCIFRYGIGYLEYHVFGFSKVHGAKKRSTFMNMDHNVSLVRMLNDPSYYSAVEDKSQFERNFAAYLGREHIDLRDKDTSDLKAFCEGKEYVFAKCTDMFGGIGVQKIDVSSIKDYSSLYNELRHNSQFLVEDEIRQHHIMNKLCAACVNTLRVVTLLKDGEPHIGYVLLRVGSGNKPVDNISSGGMYTLVGEDGVLHFPAFCDKTGDFYEHHPVTGTKFIGFEIPYFAEAIDMCKKAALEVPQMGYVGWDVGITENGPVLVEGNNFPGYDMPQNSCFHTDGTGILPKFEKILGMKIPRNYRK